MLAESYSPLNRNRVGHVTCYSKRAPSDGGNCVDISYRHDLMQQLLKLYQAEKWRHAHDDTAWAHVCSLCPVTETVFFLKDASWYFPTICRHCTRCHGYKWRILQQLLWADARARRPTIVRHWLHKKSLTTCDAQSSNNVTCSLQESLHHFNSHNHHHNHLILTR